MPTYCYANENGEVIEHVCSINKRPKTIKRGGVIYRRCFQAEWDHGRGPEGVHPGGWPIVSETSGVHPSQIKEAEAFTRKQGVPTHYTKDGRPILTNRSHRRKFCKAMGMRDRDAGYGDHSGD
ncbi:hypothetical protein LCGC14_2929440 [marine sediment metagenome]|uniref:Uncharacterized protein n=1 Tax=marine sediment metagenome TaxID=412755 RepID=A0A0F8XLD2_9ZZZZ